MRLRVIAAIAAGAWLMAGSAAAQAVSNAGAGRPISFTPAPVQPPPPPMPTPLTPIIPTTPPPPADLFRAGPDTYAPRFDRLNPNQSLFFPYAVVAGYPPAYDDHFKHRGTTIIVTAAPIAGPQAAATTPPAATAPAPAGPPGVPKTLYVITGCYAGDTPPRADRLPPGCTLKGMRRIEPTRTRVQ